MTKRTQLALFCSSLSFSFALGACAGPDDEEAPPASEMPQVLAARAHLAAMVPQVSPADLEVTRARVDDLGMTHVRQRQSVDGIPVLGGEAIVHLDADGNLRDITDRLVRDVRVDTKPTLDGDAAIERALAATVGVDRATAAPTADLRIVRLDDGDHLAWQVAIESLPAADVAAWTKPLVLIDAHRGDVLHQQDRVLESNVNGTGTARYAGSVGFRTWLDPDGKYYLEDDVRKVGAFDLNNGASDGSIARYVDNDNNWTAIPTAVQAHWALAKTWDYYKAHFSREGIDANYGPGYANAKAGGKLVTGLVHWESNANNAKWVDPQMVFGDGDGSLFSPLVSLDIVAHEWTHGVTSREAQLDGLNETPALHEHLSDVFGAATEAWFSGGVNANTWLLGEQAFTPGTAGDALRYLNDPAKDNVSLDYWTSDLDTKDGHDGAGVGNLAFYLTVAGGNHPRRSSPHVTGVGIDKAQRVWYRALVDHLTSNANYSELRAGTLSAAADLYGAGGATYRALHSAWEAVGIPSVSTPGFPNRQTGSFSTVGQAAIFPSGGFWSGDGHVVGFLGHDQADDFDLELWRYYPSTSSWVKVDSAVGPGNNEVVDYGSGVGTTYRWRVKSTSGTGGYEVGWSQ